MNYYIVVNGVKEGPYDILSFIKKVKNGTVDAQTQVSINEAGPYRPAIEVEELKSIIKAEVGQVSSHDVKIDIMTLLNDSSELWIRRVVEYTLFFGMIIVAGFGISTGLNGSPFFADYIFVTNYIISVICFTLFGFFTCYVLTTKRSQDLDKSEIKGLLKFSLAPLLMFSALISIFILLVGINAIITVITLVVMTITLTVLIFVPLLVTDHKMGLKRAVVASIEGFRSLDISAMVLILVIISINIAGALVPAIIDSRILLLGLIVIVPLSLTIIAHIYDHVLA